MDVLDIEKTLKEILTPLYLEMYNKLLIYANATLRDKSLAEEAVQETFRIACSKKAEFIDHPNKKGWLMVTLKNVISNMIKSRARLNKLVVSAMAYDEALIVKNSNNGEVESDIDIMYADLLDEEDFRLLKMVVLNKLSMKEAAEVLGIGIEACKKRVQRAKEKLKKILEETME